jgi:hypothetical protein
MQLDKNTHDIFMFPGFSYVQLTCVVKTVSVLI